MSLNAIALMVLILWALSEINQWSKVVGSTRDDAAGHTAPPELEEPGRP